MRSGASFRLAGPKDAELIEQGLKGLSEALDDPYEMKRDYIRKLMMLEYPPAHVLLAEKNGLAGMSMFSPVVSAVYGMAGAYISDLWVHPDQRGESLGARLLTATLGEGRAKWDAQYLSLVVYEDNPRARKFYEREGFVCKSQDKLMILTPETIS